MGTTAQKLQAVANSKAAIKSAIEAKGVSNVGDVLADYATKIADIPTGGGSKYGLTLDNMLGDVNGSGALQPPSASGAFSSSAIVSIPDYGLYYKFYSYTSSRVISEVNLPNVTTIGESGMYYAFYNQTALSTIIFSNLTTIGNDGLNAAFMYSEITGISFPKLTTIGVKGFYNAFRYCDKITSVDLSKLTSVLGSAFQLAFSSCTRLQTVDLSGLTTITNATGCFQQAFLGCTGLKTVLLNKLSSVSGNNVFQNTFNGCTALEVVNCSESQSVWALTNNNTFPTDAQNPNYKVVVPDALYNDWIAASNWSAISSHIVKASEYTPAS